jgi:hypothetical protein
MKAPQAGLQKILWFSLGIFGQHLRCLVTLTLCCKFDNFEDLSFKFVTKKLFVQYKWHIYAMLSIVSFVTIYILSRTCLAHFFSLQGIWEGEDLPLKKYGRPTAFQTKLENPFEAKVNNICSMGKTITKMSLPLSASQM